MIDTNDNTVTVCMDYIKGRCSREKCKYFHPPAHLQAKIKAAQYQVNQAAAAQAAATAAAMVSAEGPTARPPWPVSSPSLKGFVQGPRQLKSKSQGSPTTPSPAPSLLLCGDNNHPTDPTQGPVTGASAPSRLE